MLTRAEAEGSARLVCLRRVVANAGPAAGQDGAACEAQILEHTAGLEHCGQRLGSRCADVVVVQKNKFRDGCVHRERGGQWFAARGISQEILLFLI